MFVIRGFLGGLAGAVLAGVFSGVIGFVLQYSEANVIALAMVSGTISGLLGFGIMAIKPRLARLRHRRSLALRRGLPASRA